MAKRLANFNLTDETKNLLDGSIPDGIRSSYVDSLIRNDLAKVETEETLLAKIEVYKAKLRAINPEWNVSVEKTIPEISQEPPVMDEQQARQVEQLAKYLIPRFKSMEQFYGRELTEKEKMKAATGFAKDYQSISDNQQLIELAVNTYENAKQEVDTVLT